MPRSGIACLPLKSLIAAAGLALAAIPAAAQSMPEKIEALVPELEALIATGMKDFDNPGLAIGIVTGDKLVYSKGFGVRSKGGEPVDTKTVFQIGSTTKAFLATTIAIGVDKKKFAFEDRAADLKPDFQMMDPWVTHEMRLFDLLTQRSGLPAEANDGVGMLGATQAEMVHSLRAIPPVSSFRMAFSYTNITHIVAGDIVADGFGKPDWASVVRDEIFTPLGMASTSITAEEIEASTNHAEGHRWTSDGTVEVPFTPIFPYNFVGAGAINSNIEDLSTWVRMHLAGGTVDGKRIVSEEALAFTKSGRVPISDKLTYAMGWVVQLTPNGQITWHNGGTTAFGAFIGTVRDHDIGVVVLTNETNVGLPDALGEWVLYKLLGNDTPDLVGARLKQAKAAETAGNAVFAMPAKMAPAMPLDGLAGDYSEGSFGDATVAVKDDAVTLTLARTGAILDFRSRGGYLFDVSLRPEGRFADIAANLGPQPLGFAEFETDTTGAYNSLVLKMPENGQSYTFERKQ